MKREIEFKREKEKKERDVEKWEGEIYHPCPIKICLQ
jgi:hypothetical protein